MSVNPIEPNAQERKHYSGIKLLSILAGGFFLLFVATMLVPSVLNVDYMFTMGAVLITLPLASLAMGKIWARGISAERGPIGPIVEGEKRDVSVYVRQRFPTNILLELDDSLPAGLTSIPRMPVTLHLRRGGAEVRYSVLAGKRGVYRLGELNLRVFDPLGIIGLMKRFSGDSELVVYSRPLPLESWMLMVGPAPAGSLADILTRPMAGASGDFYGTREYFPGDDLRRIHWKSVARVQELVVKEFSDDVDITDVLVAVDTKPAANVPDGEDSPLDYACRVAAHVAEKTLSMNGNVFLATAATPGAMTAQAGSNRDLPLILDHLARATSDSRTSLADVIVGVDSYLRQGTAVVVIGSQVDDALRTAVGRLLARGVVVAQVHVDSESFSPKAQEQPEREYLLDPRIPCWRVSRGGRL